MGVLTTNSTGESSLSLNQAAEAISKRLNPQESSSEDHPAQGEEESTEVEQVTEDDTESEDSTEQEEHTEETEESTEETSEVTEDDEFDFAGERIKASQLKEWRESGLRMADYTKKTQELAQAKREWEEEKAREADSFRRKMEERLAAVADTSINALKQFESVDWDKLRQDDPYTYQSMWVDYQREKERALVNQREIAKHLEEERERNSSAKQERLKREAEEAIRLIPELGDPEKAPKLMSEMAEYLKGVGMTKEEMEAIESSKAYVVIMDAMRYKKLSQQKDTLIKQKKPVITKVVKPGSTTAKATAVDRDVKQLNEQRAQLRKSGSLRDAANLLNTMVRKKG